MKKDRLNILYEDKYIIIVSKPYGLLTISNEKEKENTLFHKVLEFEHKKNNKVFIVHRLDKDTSGLVIFAKNEKIKYTLQDEWLNTKRGYISIVHGKLKKNKDTINTYLSETSTHLVYNSNKLKGKEAITNYEVIKSNEKYSLLKINIETGRHHQIRVHLSTIGNPIVGDKIYGINDKEKRLYLHANYLEFIHPITKEKIIIEDKYPLEFNNKIKQD